MKRLVLVISLTVGLSLVDEWGSRIAAGELDVLFPCGDVNGDGTVDLSDAVYLLNWKFGGGPAPICPESPDVPVNSSMALHASLEILQSRPDQGSRPSPLEVLLNRRNGWRLELKGATFEHEEIEHLGLKITRVRAESFDFDFTGPDSDLLNVEVGSLFRAGAPSTREIVNATHRVEEGLVKLNIWLTPAAREDGVEMQVTAEADLAVDEDGFPIIAPGTFHDAGHFVGDKRDGISAALFGHSDTITIGGLDLVRDEDLCAGAMLLVKYTRWECRRGFWVNVTYADYLCPDGNIVTIEESLEWTNSRCTTAEATRVELIDAVEAADVCNDANLLVRYTKWECRDGVWANVTYADYLCPNGSIETVEESVDWTDSACR